MFIIFLKDKNMSYYIAIKIKLNTAKQKMNKLPYVKEILESYRPFLKTEFENSKPDKAKEYDYKIGL